jgi:hypothetical protein
MMGRACGCGVANVVDEMASIVKDFPGLKAIFFEDDTFAAIRKVHRDLAGDHQAGDQDLLVHQRTGRPRLRAMKIMKAAGCRCMCVGFESGSKLLLENIKKKMTIEKMHQFVADARKAGILVHGCFMVGHPGETKETMEQTLELAKQLTPDTVQFYPIMVYPGTEATAGTGSASDHH